MKMTWIRKSYTKSWVHKLCENTLKCGPIPRHIAFIMDGNRRFAQRHNYDRAKGHSLGFDKLSEVKFVIGINILYIERVNISNVKHLSL